MLRKTKEHKIDRLRRLPLFTACSDAEMRSLASVMDEVEVAPGAVLAREGRLMREFIVLAGGRAAAWSEGKQVDLLTFGERIGDTELITGETASVTVIAETPCKLVVTDARRFYALIEQTPSVARHLLKDHALRSRHANDRAFGKVVALPALRLRPVTA